MANRPPYGPLPEYPKDGTIRPQITEQVGPGLGPVYFGDPSGNPGVVLNRQTGGVSAYQPPAPVLPSAEMSSGIRQSISDTSGYQYDGKPLAARGSRPPFGDLPGQDQAQQTEPVGMRFAQKYGQGAGPETNAASVIRQVADQLTRASANGALKGMSLDQYDQWFSNNPAVAGQAEKYGGALSALYEKMMPTEARRAYQLEQAGLKFEQAKAEERMRDAGVVAASKGAAPTTAAEVDASLRGRADRRAEDQLGIAARAEQDRRDQQEEQSRIAAMEREAQGAKDRRVGTTEKNKDGSETFWAGPNNAYRIPPADPKDTPQDRLDELMKSYAKDGRDKDSVTGEQRDNEFGAHLRDRISTFARESGLKDPFAKPDPAAERDAAARKWLEDHPNHPQAAAVRAKLEGKGA